MSDTEARFGEPTEIERLRATDAFHFPLPQVPRDWASLVGRDRKTQVTRGSILAVALVLLSVWLWRKRLETWPIESFAGHTKPAFAVATTHRRSLVASGSDDHTVKVWSLDTGNLVRTIEVDRSPTGDGVLALAFSPAGESILTGSGHAVQLWNAETGELAHTLEEWEKGALAVAFSPKGDIAAASHRFDDAIRLYSVKDGSLVHTLRGHTGDIYALSFSPGGDHLASAGADGTVRTWSLASLHQVSVNHAHAEVALGVSWSPVGDVIASAGDDHKIRLWTPDLQSQLAEIDTKGTARSLAFTADGERLFFAGDDNVIRGFAPHLGRLVLERQETERPLALAVSPDGDRLVVALRSGEIHVWALPGR